MRNLIYLFIILPFLSLGQGQGQLVTPQNYILTTVYRDSANTSPVKTMNYYDGLGRPMQRILNKQSTSAKDIITDIVYDAYGRQQKEYLPLSSSQDNMAYKESNDVLTELVAQYHTKFNDDYPFSEKQFEQSPLNRVLKQSAPGYDWSMEKGHEIRLDYQANTDNDAVHQFSVTTAWSSSSNSYSISLFDWQDDYREGMLYKNITKNENWISGNENTTEEYKDKEGRVVLKRTFDNSNTYNTYYIYDNFGNLTYVLPPMVNVNTVNQTVLNGLCYQYKYDHRNRLVAKKLPGKQWEYIAYNNQDMPVATGPVLSPFGGSAQGWLITKYDIYGRVVYTGWLGSSSTDFETERTTFESGLDTTGWYEDYLGKSVKYNDNSIYLNYTSRTYPTEMTLLTINYYDNYIFENAPAVIPANVEGQQVLTHTKGLTTGNWVRILETPSLANADVGYSFYDKKVRPVSTHSTTRLGGFTNIDTKLDFSGKTLYTIATHKRENASTLLTVKDSLFYTPEDRLIRHSQTINNLPTQNLVVNTYDELGQLTVKDVGGIAGTPLQKVGYKYNIRGWLTNINDPSDLSIGSDPLDLFAFKINYNTVEDNVSNQIKSLYNGNIAETFWRTSTDDILRKYGYKYDNLNRLNKAIYQRPGASVPVTNMYNEELKYDANGNIVNLFRNGDYDSTLGSIPPLEIDKLTYYYDTNEKNKLVMAVDESNSPKGFKDSSDNLEDDYLYDAYGNMTKDRNKGINEVTYNYLNLPTEINFGGGNKIEYLYDAIGTKLRKKVTNNSVIKITDYLHGFQYTNDDLNFFPHAEGYVNVTTSNNERYFNYVYQYKDHLGNVRVNYGLDPSDNVLKILEESHYYPFGLKHTRYNPNEKNYAPDDNPEVLSIEAVSPEFMFYKYKYNGKEWQDELGLGLYDYQTRNYDPAIARWVNIDVNAENYYSWSPYNYVGSNPIIRTDPTGMDWFTDKNGNMTYNKDLTADNASSILQCDQTYSGTTGSEYVADGGYTISYNIDGSMSASNPAPGITGDGLVIYGIGGDPVAGSSDMKGDRGSGSIDAETSVNDSGLIAQIVNAIGDIVESIGSMNERLAKIGTGSDKEKPAQPEPTVDTQTSTVTRYDYIATDAGPTNVSIVQGYSRDTIVPKGKESVVNKLNFRDSIQKVKESKIKNAEQKRKLGY